MALGFLKRLFNVGGLFKGKDKPKPAPAPEPIIQPPEEVIPEAEALTHNEEFLVGGGALAMASSNVEEMQYDYFGNLGYPPQTLLVEFKNGSLYAYYGVPLEVAVAFVETLSPGRFVWTELRDRYPYSRITKGNIPKKKQKPNIVRGVNN